MQQQTCIARKSPRSLIRKQTISPFAKTRSTASSLIFAEKSRLGKLRCRGARRKHQRQKRRQADEARHRGVCKGASFFLRLVVNHFSDLRLHALHKKKQALVIHFKALAFFFFCLYALAFFQYQFAWRELMFGWILKQKKEKSKSRCEVEFGGRRGLQGDRKHTMQLSSQSWL
jgi:hypothetical protein